MEEIVEVNSKNFISEIALEASNPPFESEKDWVANGIPNDSLLELTDKTPYMIKVSSLEAVNPTAYCPAWRSISEARLKNGEPPTTMDQWLNRMNLLIRSGENKSVTRVATHVTMNGGRFDFSWEQEKDFLKWYAASLSLNKRMWFVEQLTPVFRYFVDLDFCQLVGIPERAMHATAKVVQRIILKFYPSLNTDTDQIITLCDGNEISSKSFDALRVVVSTTNYKFINAKENKPDMVKTGVHMIWPNLFVTRDDALNMRESIVVELEKEFGKRVHPLNSWQDVVDSSVYGSGNSGTKGSGLRMLGSRKTDLCDICKGKKKIKPDHGGEKRCEKCIGNGRLDTGRPYFALCILNTFGERDLNAEELYRRNIYELILHTKIRTPLTDRPKLPEFKLLEHAGLHNFKAGQKRGRKSNDLQKPPDSKYKKSTALDLNNSTPEWDSIQNIVRNCGQGIYKDTIVSKITTNVKKTEYVVHVNGDMCRYCHNIKREHVSNRIYFIVDVTGVSQRCHDGATETSSEMQFGLCKDYIGPLGRIPQLLVAQLFPSCSAAKTFSNLQDSIEINENEIEDHIGIRKISSDHKLARLYKIGDALSKELFNVSWSETLKTSGGEHVIARQRNLFKNSKRTASGEKYLGDQYALHPASLGSYGNTGMAELGFEDLMLDHFEVDELHEDAKKKHISISKLSAQLFKELDFMVELVASMPDDKINTIDDLTGFDIFFSGNLEINI